MDILLPRVKFPDAGDLLHSPLGMYPAPALRSGESVRLEPPWAGSLLPCPHRSAQWRCGGEIVTLCAAGRGEGGYVERDDCVGCPIVAALSGS